MIDPNILGDKLGLHHGFLYQRWEIESHLVQRSNNIIDVVSCEGHWWPGSPDFISQNLAIWSCIVSSFIISIICLSGREEVELLVSHFLAPGRLILKGRLEYLPFLVGWRTLGKVLTAAWWKELRLTAPVGYGCWSNVWIIMYDRRRLH